MRRLAALYRALDGTTRTAEKLEALTGYFASAPAEDAAWTLYALTGGKLPRIAPTPLLRAWAAEEAGIPGWLLDESMEAVGDFGEALALVLPAGPGTDLPLHTLLDERLLAVAGAPEAIRRETLVRTWRELDADQRFLWNKVLTGEFRLGAARTLVIRALAVAARLDPAVVAHRLTGGWSPTAGDYRRLLRGEGEGDPGRPYPFFLAHPLEADPATLGPVEDWLAEWKWDGIRAQVLRRAGTVAVWTRGEELVTGRYPEIAAAALSLPESTVLDGEILAWRGDGPLPFALLQRRIGRRSPDPALLARAPVACVAFDLLEDGGRDVRSLPLDERRARLAGLLGEPRTGLRLSPEVPAPGWEALAAARDEARARGVEGLMLKRRASAYGVGRPRGDWWKWKIDPHTVDAVLLAARQGSGRRAGLFTDLTFGVWDGGELVPVAKAYSGLDDAEIAEVDAFVRSRTVARHGPVRVVAPELVFELAFEAIRRSSRHRSGVAVRFPRIARWRRDKRPEEADRLDALRALLPPEPPPRPRQPGLFD